MMRKLVFFIIILSLVGPILGQTSYDVEYAQVCLIDSIAPDTVIQFWRFTQANNPGEYSVDMTFDLGSSYTVEGTVLPCCSCLTEATAINGAGGGGIGDIAQANPPPINALLLLSGAVLLALFIPKRKIAVLLILGAPAALSAQPGTTYDIEHTCICLVDSIAADTVIQFWRFTQSNNPGEYSVDVTFDMGSSYTVAGTVLSCKDYYLGDNPGGSGTANTLAMWTGTSSLGNSSVTQSGQILSSSLTGSWRQPIGTNAQEPVWAEGMMRYDSDDAAFEGYGSSPASEFFFAEAATNNLTSGSVLFSDANSRVAQDNSGLFYEPTGNELRVNTASDMGAFVLQVKDAASIFGSSSSSNRFTIGSVGQIDGKIPSGFSNYLESNAASNNCLEVKNIHTGGYAAIKAIQYGNTGIDVQMTNITKAAIQFTHSIGSSYTTEQYPIQFTLGRSTPGSTTSPQQHDINSGQGILWEYRAGAPASAFYTAAKMIPVVATTSNTVALKFYLADSITSREIVRFTPDTGVHFYDYGSGAITGTPTYFSAWDSNHKFIERSAANVVSDLGIGKGSVSTSTDGSGDIAVTHGMGTTPAQVLITVIGTTPYVCTVHTKGATTFTVRIFDMAGAAVTTTAVTFDWLAKT